MSQSDPIGSSESAKKTVGFFGEPPATSSWMLKGGSLQA
jgi:hypothetical protein